VIAMATIRSIDSKASETEWDVLYKWVEEQTVIYMDHRPRDRNPWLMPELTPEERDLRFSWMGSSFYGAGV
jgi:hypothetical protein